MKVYKIVFSSTGGTDKAASIIADVLGNDVETIDLSARDVSCCEVSADSIAVIAMPSFGGRAPAIAVERLKMVKGNGARAVAVAVYGNREQEDTLIEISDTAKECGFRVIAGIAAVAEHSIAHQYAAGRPDEKDAVQLRDFAEQIINRLFDAAEPEIPGERPYKKAGAGLVPKGSSDCVNCGICAEKCPVGAIGKSDPKKTDKSKCIGCMRCVSICPKKARTVNGAMVKVVGMALKKACTDRKENKLYLG